MNRSSRVLWFGLASLLGAVAGFSFGIQFDLRSHVNWTALGAVASFLVVLVALLPIGLEYRRHLRQERSTRDHALALLIEIEALLHLHLTTPQLGPLSQTEAAPIDELFSLIPQLDLLDEAETRHIITAAGKSRMLVLVSANPQPGHQQQEFRDASSETQKALSVVRSRTRPSMREA